MCNVHVATQTCWHQEKHSIHCPVGRLIDYHGYLCTDTPQHRTYEDMMEEKKKEQRDILNWPHSDRADACVSLQKDCQQQRGYFFALGVGMLETEERSNRWLQHFCLESTAVSRERTFWKHRAATDSTLKASFKLPQLKEISKQTRPSLIT